MRNPPRPPRRNLAESSPRWWAWGPACLWAAAIFYSSSLTVVPDFFPAVRHGDKLFHGMEFFVYGFLVQRGATQRGWPRRWRGWWRLAVVVLVTAVTDELWQGLVPMRTTDPWDALVDWGGGVAGLLGFRFNR